jgi:hypothetical protein
MQDNLIDIAINEFWNNTSIINQKLIFEDNYYKIKQYINSNYVIKDKFNNISINIKPTSIIIKQYGNIIEITENKINFKQSTMFSNKIYLKDKQFDNEYILTYKNINIIKIRFQDNFLQDIFIFDNFYYERKDNYYLNYKYLHYPFSYVFINYNYNYTYDNYNIYKLRIIKNIDNYDIIDLFIEYDDGILIKIVDKQIIQNIYLENSILGKRNITNEHSLSKKRRFI